MSSDSGIALLDRIAGDEAEQLWSFYDGIFAPLNEESPCRQSFHRDEFMEALDSPTLVKIVAQGTEATIIGLTMFAILKDEMPLMPWINPQFYKKRWPQHWGKIIYVSTICVPMDARGLGTGKKIMLAILQYMRDHRIPLIAFDHSMGRIPVLPDQIMTVTRGRPVGSFSERKELDHQVYWLLEDVDQVPAQR